LSPERRCGAWHGRGAVGARTAMIIAPAVQNAKVASGIALAPPAAMIQAVRR
jgi:hypothetical protein